jgi:purine-binding chemotaxis protein CheW
MSASASAAAVSGHADQGQYLTFMLGGEVFAIGILSIKEIIEYGHVTTVPMMPECIRGVINLRGAVVPVIDLSARFGGKASTTTRRTCIVIVEVAVEQERQVVGVVVDAVNEVLEIASTEIEPAPSFGTRIRTDFIRGMGKVDQHFVIILEANRVLSAEDFTQLEAGRALAGSSGQPAELRAA